MSHVEHVGRAPSHFFLRARQVQHPLVFRGIVHAMWVFSSFESVVKSLITAELHLASEAAPTGADASVPKYTLTVVSAKNAQDGEIRAEPDLLSPANTHVSW